MRTLPVSELSVPMLFVRGTRDPFSTEDKFQELQGMLASQHVKVRRHVLLMGLNGLWAVHQASPCMLLAAPHGQDAVVRVLGRGLVGWHSHQRSGAVMYCVDQITSRGWGNNGRGLLPRAKC